MEAGCTMIWATTFLIAITVVSAPGMAQSCSGCGCKGGPGYRGPDGKCVGWANIGKVCGSPPTTHCKAEGPSAGADKAAEHGVKALQARPERRTGGSF